MAGFRTILKVLPELLLNKNETEPRQPLGPFSTDASVYATAPASGLRVTWFGHASMLLEMDGARVLVDPVWDPRASPVTWAGPKRFFAPTLPLGSLPKLDAVLISHDHYDHMGKATIKMLATLHPEARWVTSLGCGRRLRGFGVPDGRITELDWTQSVELAGRDLGVGLKITSWPARHFSGRTPWDRFTTLWASFVLEGPKHRVYYSGDSGYWDGFRAVGELYDRFDLTAMQVGASDPRWYDIHLNPDDAIRAYQNLGGPAKAGLLMPVHWGLFNLALHGWRQPIERTTELAIQQGIPLFSPEPGLPVELVENFTVHSDWWRV